MNRSSEDFGKLSRLRVEGLLGRFDHDITFDASWRFLILHGPNGVGKTRLLELLHYAFSGQHLKLARLPFRSARFDFDNGTSVEIEKDTDTENPLFDPGHGSTSQSASGPASKLQWKLTFPQQEPIRVEEDLKSLFEDRRSLMRLEHRYPITRVGPFSWRHDRTGEPLDIYDIVERYGDELDLELGGPIQPASLQDALAAYEVHLIEAQRLLTVTRPSRHRFDPSDGPSQESTVISYGEDLSRRLARILAENSGVSQRLDRTFPDRLLRAESESKTEDAIRSQYIQQQSLRLRLAAISVLAGDQEELKLPERVLEDWERKALSIYLDDAGEKLATFDSILRQLELMRAIINRRFLFKRLEISQDSGFAFFDEESDARIGLRDLSSGEQHELVLLYQLLMHVGANSLVLIDEPEISLHVAWQNEFLDDLGEIAALNSVRFIIATHSPHIIGDHWDRTFELYRAT